MAPSVGPTTSPVPPPSEGPIAPTDQKHAATQITSGPSTSPSSTVIPGNLAAAEGSGSEEDESSIALNMLIPLIILLLTSGLICVSLCVLFVIAPRRGKERQARRFSADDTAHEDVEGGQPRSQQRVRQCSKAEPMLGGDEAERSLVGLTDTTSMGITTSSPGATMEGAEKLSVNTSMASIGRTRSPVSRASPVELWPVESFRTDQTSEVTEESWRGSASTGSPLLRGPARSLSRGHPAHRSWRKTPSVSQARGRLVSVRGTSPRSPGSPRAGERADVVVGNGSFSRLAYQARPMVVKGIYRI